MYLSFSEQAINEVPAKNSCVSWVKILSILAKIRGSWSRFKILGQDVIQDIFHRFKISSKIRAIIVCVIANSKIAIEK